MSSSDSEDENIKRFLEAADTTLINDAMFQKDPNKDHVEQKQDPSAVKPIDRPKSNRYLVEEENVFQSDISVTESMKKFVGKKLSSIIEQKIAFVDLNNQVGQKSDNSIDYYGVKLLRGCDSYLKATDMKENPTALQRVKRIKEIKKRTIEPDDMDEKGKLRLSAVEPKSVTISAKGWTNRPKAKVYEYKTKGSANILQETRNEFTDLKRKNNWETSKIATYRKKIKNR